MKAIINVRELTHEELSDFLSTALSGSFWAGVACDESDTDIVLQFAIFGEEIYA